jgi:uncharacterized protein involved in cysteine biosynthesis
MEWAQILVIILSVFLAIFLLLGIILAVLLIKVTHQIKKVTTSAQHTAESIEDAVKGFGNITSSVAIAKMVARQLKKFKKK